MKRPRSRTPRADMAQKVRSPTNESSTRFFNLFGLAQRMIGTYAVVVMDADLICYQFSRRNVEQGDFGHFLSLYSPDKLPTGPRLHQMMGTFLFAITGYDDDPRELDGIPEV